MAKLSDQQKDIYGMEQDEFDRAVAKQREYLQEGKSGLSEGAREVIERAQRERPLFPEPPAPSGGMSNIKEAVNAVRSQNPSVPQPLRTQTVVGPSTPYDPRTQYPGGVSPPLSPTGSNAIMSASEYTKRAFAALLSGNIAEFLRLRKEGLELYPGTPKEAEYDYGNRRDEANNTGGLGPTPPPSGGSGGSGGGGGGGLPPGWGDGGGSGGPNTSNPSRITQFMDPRYEWIYDPYLGVSYRRPRSR